MRRVVYASLGLVLAVAGVARAQTLTPADAEARRQAAIAAFTQKTKDANYPALFDQAAREFGVPADILKGVAFAETRWEHLTWPPGENYSPETGMPRPYGIMSLWSNQFFGYSLVEAANLIGKTPGELQQDPLQNIRGGAALLRKLYDDNPKPEGTTEADIESWRYAIRKYSGIREPDYSAQHALDVYVFMSRGYHQYGIEWDAQPVNLEPMREETRRIVAEEQAKRDALRATKAAGASGATNPAAPPAAIAVAAPPSAPVREPTHAWWLFLAVAAVLALLMAVFLFRRKPSANR